MECAKLVIDALVAIGTLALAAVAVWGEKLRAWLARVDTRRAREGIHIG